MTFTKKDLDKFWAKIDKKLDNECWIWKGAFFKSGYGAFCLQNPFSLEWKVKKAHRCAFVIAHGCQIPKDRYILHTCDNKQCVNPNHLRLGTTQDNIDDRDNKNRGVNKRVSEEVKKQIRELVKNGLEQKEVANRFGIAQPTVCRIVSGRSDFY